MEHLDSPRKIQERKRSSGLSNGKDEVASFKGGMILSFPLENYGRSLFLLPKEEWKIFSTGHIGGFSIHLGEKENETRGLAKARKGETAQPFFFAPLVFPRREIGGIY